MALPTLDALRGCGLDLHLLGKPWIHSLLSAYPARLTSLAPTKFQQCQQWRAFKEKHVILLNNNFFDALCARLTGKAICAYPGSSRQCLLSVSLAKPELVIHEVEYNWRLGQCAQRAWLPEKSWPEAIPARLDLPLLESVKISADDIIQQYQLGDGYWILCPTATGTSKDGLSKAWPNWRELHQELMKRGTPCVVCPGPGEEDYCLEHLPEAIQIQGLDLLTYAGLIQKAQGVIANDTGPMHLAAALNTPVFGIFGATDPNRTGPWGGVSIGEKAQWPQVSDVLQQAGIRSKT